MHFSLLCVICWYFFFFFKQKTAYEMRISDWSSDVCSSDLFIVSRKIEICRGLTRPQWRIDVDLQLDANGLGTAGASERKIQLAGDGIVFEQRLKDSLVHSRPGLRVRLTAELADQAVNGTTSCRERGWQ